MRLTDDCFLRIGKMNTNSLTSGFQQQANFNFDCPNTSSSHYQQTVNKDTTFGAQETQFSPPEDDTARNPGAQFRLASQYPGTNQPFPPYPGINPFLAQQLGNNHHPANDSEANQNPAQYPGNFNCPTVSQFGGTAQNKGISKPSWGNMEYPANTQTPHGGKSSPAEIQFRQVEAQFNNGLPSTNKNAWQIPVDRFTPSQCNFHFGFVRPNGQTLTGNVYKFVGPNGMKGQPKEAEKHVSL